MRQYRPLKALVHTSTKVPPGFISTPSSKRYTVIKCGSGIFRFRAESRYTFATFVTYFDLSRAPTE